MLLRRVLQLSSYLLLLAPRHGAAQPQATPPTMGYWVDSSCDKYFEKGEFDKMVQEAIDMAGKTSTRLGRGKSLEPQAYFAYEALFKHDYADPTNKDKRSLFDKIMIDDTKGISGLHKITSRADSEIRFYCDNDKRWVLAEDNPFSQIPNAEEEADKQIWNDEVNRLQYRGRPGCLDRDFAVFRRREIIGETYSATLGGRTFPYLGRGDENVWRSTVTICDVWLNTNRRRNLLASVDLQADLSRGDEKNNIPDALGMVGSALVLHELTHHTRYNSIDNEYDWKECYALNIWDSMENADSFMFFGVLMWALDRGYALDKDEEKTRIGLLKKDPDIPKIQDNTKSKRYVSCADIGARRSAEGLICKEFLG